MQPNTATNENGKAHFSDSPHTEKPAEKIDVEPATKIGTIKPPSAKHLFEQDFSKSQQKEQHRKQLAKQRKQEKETRHKACDQARQGLIKAQARRTGASSTASKRYHNRQIELAKDRENEACKLSNFR